MAERAPAPDGLRRLLDSDRVTPATRRVLHARLRDAEAALASPAPTDAAGRTLEAVVARLLALGDARAARPVARAIADRLARGDGDGWRYAVLPPDATALRLALAALDDDARARHGAPFAALDAPAQDARLRAWQHGDVEAAAWAALPRDGASHAQAARRAFEELLAECVEHHVADPRVQLAMGYDGFADATPDTPRDADAHDETAQVHGARAVPTGPPTWMPAMRRHGEDDAVDVVVVGTGAGGAPLAWRLARAGLRVVMLEAGPWWDAARDFATDEQAQVPLYWNAERISAGGDPVAFGRNNAGTGVGGTTLHFTAFTPRAHDDDFRLRTRQGAGEDWPLDPRELAPYYDVVEAVLGVAGPGAVPFPPHPLNAPARAMVRGCDALGVPWTPAANAAIPPGTAPAARLQPWRRPCIDRGFCQAGCSVGAKGSADVTWIPLAVAAGAEVRARAFALDVERAPDGRVTAVVYRQDGARTVRQRCRALVLAAGAIETPRFLLRTGLATGSGTVGRFFMVHMGVQAWGTFDERTAPWRGIPASLVSQAFHRAPDADFAGGYLLQSIGVMPVTWASQLARGRGRWGRALRDALPTYPHAAGINMLGDCLPHADNRLTLSDETDALGLPVPRVAFTMGDNERRMTAHAAARLRATWDAAGARDVWTFPRTAHTIGTCRMGGRADASVVDADGCAWDVPNLWISDNSTWPSALAANPALTIMALALRTADRMLARGAPAGATTGATT